MASKEIKYGIREGEGHGKEYPVFIIEVDTLFI